MAVTIAHASISENGNAGWDGKAKAGDQTGREVCTRSWYAKGWNVMLRYPDPEIAKKAAADAKKLAACNLDGYDQSQRNTLYQALKKYNFDVDAYIKSGEKTETDCSELMYAVYACHIPKMRRDSNAPATSTMRKEFLQWGFKEYTEKKYLTTDENLQIGDVLVKEGSHTAMAVTNGKNVKTAAAPQTAQTAQTTKGVFDMEMTTVCNGCTGEEVKALQILLKGRGFKDDQKKALIVDGDFGSRTEQAVKKAQRKYGITDDGVAGKQTWSKLLGV